MIVLHGLRPKPYSGLPYPDIVTHIVHTDVALANLHRACPVMQEKSLPVLTSDLAFDNDV